MDVYRDRAPHVMATVAALMLPAYITYGMRVYVRMKLSCWGIDDWLMTFALLPFTVLSVVSMGASCRGIGMHMESFLEPGEVDALSKALFWFLLTEIMYCVSIIPIKLSIGFLLVRVAEGRKGYIWSQYIVMVLFTTSNLAAALVFIFMCKPVAASWNLRVTGTCLSYDVLIAVCYGMTAVNIATDWFTALLPLRLLRHANLNRNLKLSVAGIMSLGVFASMSACVRLKCFIEYEQPDLTYGVADIVIWGYAENATGILVGNLSTLRPLFMHMFKLDTFDGSSGSRKSRIFRFMCGAPSRNFPATYELSNGRNIERHPSQSCRHSKLILADPYGEHDHKTEISRGGNSPSADPTASQEQILAGVDTQREKLEEGKAGIMVRKAVNITRSASTVEPEGRKYETPDHE